MCTSPINFDDPKELKWMYTSQDAIFEVVVTNQNYELEFLICDEPNYVKKWIYREVKNRWELVIDEDYFVGNHFGIPNQPFMIVNKMLYQGFKGSLLQQKDLKTEDLVMFWEPEAEILPIEKVNSWHYFPNQFILLWGGTRKDSENQSQTLFYLPEYNKPNFSLFIHDYNLNLENTYFFYHCNDYIIFHFGSVFEEIEDHLIQVRRVNGDLHQILKIKKFSWGYKFNGDKIISPNGRYIASLISKFETNEEYQTLLRSLKIIVYELIMEKETKQFNLKEVRIIEDAFDIFSFKKEYSDPYTPEFLFSLTNNKEIFLI